MENLKVKEAYSNLVKDLTMTKEARVLSINEVSDLLLNEEKEWNPVAESFLLHEMRIPVSYYRNSLSTHKGE